MNESTSPALPAGKKGSQAKRRQPQRPQRTVHPLLQRLWQLHPLLFGAQFRPLKVGIFEDLMERHPDAFAREDLKQALAQHVRSTRYLDAVAEGEPRCGLDGQAVEPVALEHVHHAIVEVWRRRTGKDEAKARAQAVERLVRAIDGAGLTRESFGERIRSNEAQVQQLHDEALALIAERAARRVALQRAYAASGRSVEEFAEMYGMDAADVRAAIGTVAEGG